MFSRGSAGSAAHLFILRDCDIITDYDMIRSDRKDGRAERMTRKKLFMMIQAVLCAATAVLLAAGALSLYLDGAAKQAEGDLFYAMYTREKVRAKLMPVLPLLFSAIGMTIAGAALGIRDENAEKPAADGKLLRDYGRMQERAVRREADRKTKILRAAVLAAAVILTALGILNGGAEDVLAKGAAVCAECIGLG